MRFDCKLVVSKRIRRVVWQQEILLRGADDEKVCHRRAARRRFMMIVGVLKLSPEKVFPKSIIIIFKPLRICIRCWERLHNAHTALEIRDGGALSLAHSHRKHISLPYIFDLIHKGRITIQNKVVINTQYTYISARRPAKCSSHTPSPGNKI